MKMSVGILPRNWFLGLLVLFMQSQVGSIFAANLLIYSRGVNENTNLFIITHGRGGSSDSDYIQTLAAAVKNRYPNYFIMLYDWRELADASLGFLGFGGEDNIPAAADILATALSNSRIPKGSINLIGHSWGTLVSYEAAKQLGGVHTIIAIDPAADFPTGYNTSLADFGRYSDRAWSISTPNIASNPITPPTADESFVVLGSEHVELVRDFARMIASPLGVGILSFDRLFAGFSVQNVLYNSLNVNGEVAYSGGYDILLDRTSLSASSVHKPILRLRSVSNGVINIDFDSYFPFHLYWSADLSVWNQFNSPPTTVSNGQNGYNTYRYSIQLGNGSYQFRTESQIW